MRGANITFGGGIAILIGTLISLSAIEKGEYLWLIGSGLLILAGLGIIINEFRLINKEKKK